MISFMSKLVDEFTKALPATIARLLLLTAVIGAAMLHITSIRRIESIEMKQYALEMKVLPAVEELTNEVRGYRRDIIDQNRELREQRARDLRSRRIR